MPNSLDAQAPTGPLEAVVGGYGPGRIDVDVWCDGCQFEVAEPYRCQGDSGIDYYCTYNGTDVDRQYKPTGKTPTWCPLPGQIELRIRKVLDGVIDTFCR